MFDVKSILSFLRDYELDRQSVQFLHDELARLTEIKTELPASSQGALDEEYGQLQARLLMMSNRVSRIERLLSNLTPEEQLVVDKMILHPYKNCTFDLMEQLECERTTVYKLRAHAVKKLCRLYYGVGE